MEIDVNNQESVKPKTYEEIRHTIVPIVSRVSQNPEFPDIIGTGFIAHTDGIIMTCGHVVKAIPQLPRYQGSPPNEWPARVEILYLTKEGMLVIPVEIIGIAGIAAFEGGKYYYGPDIPDVGFIHINVKNLPVLNISTEYNYSEGNPVAISGFPLGTQTLRAPGWLHQVTPTIQHATIAAILPYPCNNPHAILLDVMAKPGSSGSPVLDMNSREVIALVYGGINDTTLTLVIPHKIIRACLKSFLNHPEYLNRNIPQDDFEEILNTRQREVLKPKEPHLDPCEIEKFAIK